MPANFKFTEVKANNIKANEYSTLLTVKIQNQGTEASKCFFGINDFVVSRLVQPNETINATLSGSLCATTTIKIHTGWYVSNEEYKITDVVQTTIPIAGSPATEEKDLLKYLPLSA